MAKTAKNDSLQPAGRPGGRGLAHGFRGWAWNPRLLRQLVKPTPDGRPACPRRPSLGVACRLIAKWKGCEPKWQKCVQLANNACLQACFCSCHGLSTQRTATGPQATTTPATTITRSRAKKKADSTLRTSRAVPHPSTDRALCRLTSEVRRDPVHSTRYGRQRKCLYNLPLTCTCNYLETRE